MSDSSIKLSAVPVIRKRLRDIEHTLAVVLLQLSEGHGVAVAVVRAESGEVLAWDDYNSGSTPPANPKAILDLDWDDWDDMPSKLVLHESNSGWMPSLAHWMMPEYSVARAAAELVVDHADSETQPDTLRRLKSAPVVAYVPVVDVDVFEKELAKA